MLIQSRRLELAMSLEEVAKKANMTSRQVKILESRRGQGLGYKFMKPLARALDLESSVLAKFVGRKWKETNSGLGGLVRARRLELAISIAELAERLGVSRQFISVIELGQCRLSVNDDMVERLAEILEIDIHELQAVRLKRRLKWTKSTPGTFGRFLAEKRMELQLSQRELGERVGMTTSVVSGLETGRIPLTLHYLDGLKRVLNCQIPPEFIPSPSSRRFIKKKETALGKFLTTRRQELELNQAQVAHRAGTATGVITGIECGYYRPSRNMLEKIAKTLECEIPSDLMPPPKEPRAKRQGSCFLGVRLTDQSDLETIEELSGVRSVSEIVRKALKLLRWLLEKQRDGYTVCLRKGEEIVEQTLLI